MATNKLSANSVYLTVGIFYIAVGMTEIMVRESVIYNKVCYNHFSNITLCTNTTFTKTHPALQKDAATWANYVSAIQILPAVLTNLILSSYCDNVGHRLPIGLPTVGFALGTAWLAVLATSRLISLPIDLLLVYGFLYSFLGGSPLMTMSSYSYVTSVTPPERMSVAMALLEGAVQLGYVVGLLASGPLADHYGLDTLSYINVGIASLPAVVVVLFIKEVPRENQRAGQSWKDFVGITHMLDAVLCVFKKRRHYNRLLLHLCYLTNFSVSVALSGYNANSFLYFNKEVGMTLTQLSIFSSCLMAVKGVGGPVILYLNKRVTKINQLSLAVVSCAFLAAGYIIMSIPFIHYGIWFGGAMLSFQSVVISITRALQVKLVEEGEVGKVFAYDGFLQVIFALVTYIFFKEIYSLSVVSFPSIFLSICAFLNVFSMIILVIICFLYEPASSEESSPLLHAT